MNAPEYQPSLWGEGGPPGTETLPLPLPAPSQRVTHVGGHPVRIGTSGFSFPDWDGAFYPRGLPSGRRLEFYARYFPTVEINSTYYGIPEPRTFRLLLEKSPGDFDFVVKAHQSMTHEEATPPESYDQLLRAVEPVRAADRLEGILAQFPWRFRRTPEAERHLLDMRARLDGLPLFAEFRHDSWAREEVFDFLTGHGIGYCCVDEPALEGLVPPVARLTTEVAYVRFHGRNAKNWWGGEGDRYDYDYRPEELAEWHRKIRELAERAKKTYVFFNNCHAGQAARNARLMMDMMQGDLG
jgi:uncharacterized protein YecE (DUF72 family)